MTMLDKFVKKYGLPVSEDELAVLQSLHYPHSYELMEELDFIADAMRQVNFNTSAIRESYLCYTLATYTLAGTQEEKMHARKIVSMIGRAMGDCAFLETYLLDEMWSDTTVSAQQVIAKIMRHGDEPDRKIELLLRVIWIDKLMEKRNANKS